MDQYEASYNNQVSQVDEIVALHKDNESLYENAK